MKSSARCDPAPRETVIPDAALGRGQAGDHCHARQQLGHRLPLFPDPELAPIRLTARELEAAAGLPNFGAAQKSLLADACTAGSRCQRVLTATRGMAEYFEARLSSMTIPKA